VGDHGKGILLEEGATYVFDKGYYDYNWCFKMHQESMHFEPPKTQYRR
jgi:hypothetical protein